MGPLSRGYGNYLTNFKLYACRTADIYGGCVIWSRDSIKVCESLSIDKQVKAVIVALEKDLVPLQPSRPRCKAEKKKAEPGNFPNRFVGDTWSALV